MIEFPTLFLLLICLFFSSYNNKSWLYSTGLQSFVGPNQPLHRAADFQPDECCREGQSYSCPQWGGDKGGGQPWWAAGERRPLCWNGEQVQYGLSAQRRGEERCTVMIPLGPHGAREVKLQRSGWLKVWPWRCRISSLVIVLVESCASLHLGSRGRCTRRF